MSAKKSISASGDRGLPLDFISNVEKSSFTFGGFAFLLVDSLDFMDLSTKVDFGLVGEFGVTDVLSGSLEDCWEVQV